MRTRYKATFVVGASGDHRPPTLTTIREDCRSWFRDIQLRPGAEVRELSTTTEDGKDVWAVNVLHPDNHDEGVRWSTEIGLRTMKNGRTAFTCANSYGTLDGIVAPTRKTPSRPRIVRDIVKNWGAHREYPLEADPVPLLDSHPAAQRFLAILTDPRRTLPVVFISALRETDRPAIDPKPIADWLAGIAYVWAEENRFPSDKLRSAGLPEHLRCWDGAIRIYWPRFNLFADSFAHDLWHREEALRIERHTNGKGMRERLLGQIAIASQYARTAGELRMADAEALDRSRAMAKLRETGDDKTLLEMAIADNATRAEQIAELTSQAAELTARLQMTEQQEAYWKQQYLELAAKSNSTAPPPDAPAEIESVEHAISEAQRRFSERLAFALNGKSEKRSAFEEPTAVFQFFEFLATDYWEAHRSQSSQTSSFDHALRQRCGFFYRGSQSELTMKTYRDWYTTSWRGRTLWLGPHAGKGTSREERYSIRIGFVWDDEAQLVVIGFIGQHPKTDNS